MSIVRHGKCVVDDVLCRGHHQVREGVCEGFEEEQGSGPGPGRGGHGLVAGQRPPPTYRGREAAARWRQAGREEAEETTLAEVHLRDREGAAAGVGGLGRQCGKYLAVSMRLQLDGLERHGELVDGVDRYSSAVRGELLAMSAASIDRCLKPAKATDQICGVSTTKPSPLLRSAIKIRKAGDEVEAEPGFFEGDTVAHCGPA